MFRVTVDANCVRGECTAATVYHGVATVASVVKPSTSLQATQSPCRVWDKVPEGSTLITGVTRITI